MTIVFGVGSGRCGTTSLQALINAQENGVCFHEVNPACMAWTGTESTVISILNDFTHALSQKPRGIAIDRTESGRSGPLEKYLEIDNLKVIGDVASYYLPYVDLLLSASDIVRIPCLRREKHAVVESFKMKVQIKRSLTRKLRRRPKYSNHWVMQNQSRWRPDKKWNALMPTFSSTESLEEALEQYWEMYYQRADVLQKCYPDQFRVFDMEALNSRDGREAILRFCGFDNPNIDGVFHENQS